MNDAVLLEKWRKEKDPDAFAALVTRYANMVYATCLRVLRDTTEAEDIAQDCFIELAQSAFRAQTSLGGWLHTQAVHRSLNRIRERQRRTRREKKYARSDPTTVEPDVDDIQHWVDEAIVALPKRFRLLLVAHFFEGESYAALAKTFAIPRSTAAHRVQRGVELIRRRLRKQGVITSVGTLGVFLTEQSATAAPISLTGSLVKFAIAGTTGSALLPGAAGMGTITGVLLMTVKTKITLVASALILGLALYASYEILWQGGRIEGPATPVPLTKEVQASRLWRAPPSTESVPALMPKVQNTSPGLLDAEDEPDEAVETGKAPAFITGQVMDDAGDGIDGARIGLIISGADTTHYTTTSNKAGQYSIDDINVFGEARLFASAEGFCDIASKNRKSRVSAPVVKHIQSGMTYEGLDFQLNRATASIAGRVVDSNHNPIPGAQIIVAKQLGEESSQDKYVTVSDENGEFSLSLPEEAEVMLHTEKEGYGKELFTDVFPGMEDLELMLRECGIISGRVTNTNGEALAGLTVFVEGEMDTGTVRNTWESCGRSETMTDEEGKYRVADLSEDYTYTVRIPQNVREAVEAPERPGTLSEYLLVQEARVQEIEEFIFATIPGQGIAVESGQRVEAGKTTTVDFEVDDQRYLPAYIHGYVTDAENGKPVSALSVFTTYDSPDAQHGPVHCSDTTGLDGGYTLRLAGLPGLITVQVKVRFSGYGLSEEFVADVDVEAGLRQQLDFTAPGTITVPVQCITPDGAPVEGARVGRYLTDQAGRTTFWGMAPYVSHVIGATKEVENSTRVVLGKSAPFSGKPGETIPEVSIVCEDLRGAVAGQLVLPPDINESTMRGGLPCKLLYDDGLYGIGPAAISSNGKFIFPQASAGICNVSLWLWDRESNLEYWALIEDVEIIAGETIDLGIIALNVSPR